jgi:AraC-like DNA-binding protein
VLVKIENWLDLGGVKHFNYLMLFLFSAVVYGLFLIFLVYRVEKKNYFKFRSLLLFNGLIILSLFGGVVYDQSNFIWQARISLIAYVATYIWGPFLCLYLCSIVNIKGVSKLYLHLIPMFFLLSTGFLLLINFKPLQILSYQINSFLNLEHAVLFGFSLFFTILYHIKIWKKLRQNQNMDDKLMVEKKFVKTLFLMSVLILLGLFLNFLLAFWAFQWNWFEDYEFALSAASLILLVQLYYFWNYPEIIRQKGSVHVIGNVQYLIEKIEYVMAHEKPYKNPELSIAELSEILDSKPHLISKVINDYYQKNYRDFINEYRINEFIRAFKSKEYKNFTFLALANEVGFNSKSTFNLAFKKYTKRSPREYFKVKQKSWTI